MKPRFCIICKQRVEGNLIMRLITRAKVWELKDGTYCDTCAKIVVDKRRKGGWKALDGIK